MTWQKLTITPPDLGVDLLASIVDTLRETLEALVGILELALDFVGVLLDPFTAVLKGLIDQIKAVVEQFLNDLGGYCLFVPIRKRLGTTFRGLGDITPSWADDLGLFSAPTSPIGPLDPGLNLFLADANRFDGGNAGFFKTVFESLADEGDTNRPQFEGANDWVGGFVLVMGTEFDPLGFLDDLWKLSGIFGGPPMVAKVPKPTGLQAQAIQGITDKKFHALLLWDLLEEPVFSLPDLGGTILVPERYAILRGKNTPGHLTATNVVDLTGKRDLKEGETFTNGDMVVVKEAEYDISVGSYMDKNIPAKYDDVFYYVVAWKLKPLRGKEKPGTDYSEAVGPLEYWHISNVARVTPYPTLPASTPPDWIRTPSIADIFPEFASVLHLIVAQIDGFGSKLTGLSDMLKDYIDFLKAEISRYEIMVSSIIDAISRLSFKLILPDAGVYIRPFKGRGGNDFFIADLAASFSGGEKGTPPFSKGDEFVAGAVIMAGGEEHHVDAFMAGLSWIFGGPPEPTDLLYGLLGTAGLAVAALEEQVFAQDMQKKKDTDLPESTKQFSPDMQPIASDPEETPQFGKDMQVN